MQKTYDAEKRVKSGALKLAAFQMFFQPAAGISYEIAGLMPISS